MEHFPVEIWQQILLKVMETGEGPIFMTSCTPYTFLYLVNQQTHVNEHRKQYYDYLERRRRLRLVCRAWNEFVLLSRHRWLQLNRWSPVSSAGGVRPVERLSMTINSGELVVPFLSWTSHILQRPADQSPLRAYSLRLSQTPTRTILSTISLGEHPNHPNTPTRRSSYCPSRWLSSRQRPYPSRRSAPHSPGSALSS